jgi:Arc/MetJ-type ribon-helix-helix transcriptional regulator
MTKVAKLTISLPREQADEVRAAVNRGDAASVSSYISAALVATMPASHTEEDDTLADLMADMIAEYGRPSPEAYAWADEVLGLTGSTGAK